MKKNEIDDMIRITLQSVNTEPDDILYKRLKADISFDKSYSVRFYRVAITGLLIMVLLICSVRIQTPTEQDFLPNKVVVAERIEIPIYKTKVVKLTNIDRISIKGASFE